MSFDLDALKTRIAQHTRVARIVIVATKGSGPRDIGTEMLVWDIGQSGTIGGGQLEWEATKRARDMLGTGGTRYDAIPLGPELGQCCGGHVSLVTEVFDDATFQTSETETFLRRISGDNPLPLSIERAQAQHRNGRGHTDILWDQGWLLEAITSIRNPVWIWGAGHVGRAIANVLSPLPTVAITWIDTAENRFPDDDRCPADRVIAKDMAGLVPYAPKDAAHLILTYSHKIDLELCHALLDHSFAFAGLIGSKTKWARFQKRLLELGHAPQRIDTITCPIGRPALGKHPQSIAIGVADQLMTCNAAARSRTRTA